MQQLAMKQDFFVPGHTSAVGGPYPAGRIEPNYPRNQWWVVATSGEVSREPLQR